MALSGTVGSYSEFNYTGGVQSINVPVDGIYKLEVWGGCSFLENSVMEPQWGARGGYSVGYKKLKKNDVLYVCCGGAALGKYHVAAGTYAGGYNGGGSFTTNRNDCWTSGGGGATHISLNSKRGVLKNYYSDRNEILIVVGGAGGCGCVA